MKSILIIGLGRFGTHLCQDLAKLDNEIMIVDKDEASLEDLLPLVVSAKIGDCTNEKVLKSLGVDMCIIQSDGIEAGDYNEGMALCYKTLALQAVDPNVKP